MMEDLTKLSLDEKLKLLGQNLPMEQFRPIVAKAYKVPLDVVDVVEGLESSGDQSAASPKGARGRMQLIPGTASMLGVNPDIEHENVIGGIKYLSDLNKRFEGDWAKTLWGYNAGPERVNQGVLPAETDQYLTNARQKLQENLEAKQKLLGMSVEDKLKLLEENGVDTTAIRSKLAEKAEGYVKGGAELPQPTIATPGQIANAPKPPPAKPVTYDQAVPEAGLFEATQEEGLANIGAPGGYNVYNPSFALGAPAAIRDYITGPISKWYMSDKSGTQFRAPTFSGETAHVNVDKPETFVLSKEEIGAPTYPIDTKELKTEALSTTGDVILGGGLMRLLMGPLKSAIPAQKAAQTAAQQEAELAGIADAMQMERAIGMTGGGYGTKFDALLKPTWEDIAAGITKGEIAQAGSAADDLITGRVRGKVPLNISQLNEPSPLSRLYEPTGPIIAPSEMSKEHIAASLYGLKTPEEIVGLGGVKHPGPSAPESPVKAPYTPQVEQPGLIIPNEVAVARREAEVARLANDLKVHDVGVQADIVIAEGVRGKAVLGEEGLPSEVGGFRKFLTDESGNYDFDVMNKKLADAFKAAIEDPKAGAYTGIVNNIAKQFEVKPEKVIEAIRSTSSAKYLAADPVTQSVARKIKVTADQEYAPWVEASEFMQSLPSMRDVSINEAPKPMKSMITGAATDPTNPAVLRRPEARHTSSPSNLSYNAWPVGNDPVLDMSLSMQTQLFEQTRGRRFGNLLLRDLGFEQDSYRAHQAIENELFPIREKWFGELKPQIEAESQINGLKEKLKKTAEGSKGAAAIEDQIAQLQQIVDQPVSLKAQEIFAEAKAKIQELGERFSSVRIKLATEGKWDGPLTVEEQKVVKGHREYYDIKTGQMQDRHMPIRDPGSYVPYSYLDADDMPLFTDERWWNKGKPLTPEQLNFMHRTSDIDWFPHAFHTFDGYVGAVERKLAINDWLGKWRGSMNKWRATDRPTYDFINDFYTNQTNVAAMDIYRKIGNAIIDGTYGVYLGANPSPALLHLFKGLRVLAAQGEEATAYGIGKYAQGSMQRLGGAIGRKLGIEELAAQANKPEAKMLDFFVPSRQLIEAMTNNPELGEIAAASYWRKIANSPIINPTRLTEHLVRGINSFATMYNGAKVGASTEEIFKAVMQSLTRWDFFAWDLPGALDPRRSGTPGGLLKRMAGMFMGQPWKITEGIEQMLYDAVTGRKDIFGNSQMTALLRLATYSGATLAVGAHLLDVDLGKHVFHLPGTTHDMGGQLTFSTSPFFSLGGTIAREGLEKGVEEFTNYIGVGTKAFNEKFPDWKYSTRAHYIAGLPKFEWEEEAEKRAKYRSFKRGEWKRKSNLDYLKEMFTGSD